MTQKLIEGSQVQLGQGTRAKAWWKVRSADERFAILTRPRSTAGKGSEYTIIDRVRGVRGPCDLIGQGWDVDADGGCASLLRALNFHLEVASRLEAGEKRVVMTETSTEVSHRNNVPVEILNIKP
ncbi:hypothetical protein [Arthrobacter sp. UYCo732]|uniref:hypothetical protein n=1 Tax=Arthrobacter sp. UYCo732 TaxID=3156336 RepID=UPI003397733F